MGDKSPKATQKQAAQKTTKDNDSQKKKDNATALKQTPKASK